MCICHKTTRQATHTNTAPPICKCHNSLTTISHHVCMCVCMCVCVCVCVCVFTKISAMFEPLPYHTGNQTYTNSLTLFWLHSCICGIQAQDNTHTHIQYKHNCLHIHRYAYLYEHVQIFYLDICIPSLELLYSVLSTRPLHWYM